MNDDNKVLKIVYTFFLGVLIAIFIGVGIDTFYPSPESPDYPVETQVYDDSKQSKAQIEKQKEYDRAQRQYEAEVVPYNRDVSIIALVSAVVLLAASLYVEKRHARVLADGVMLGGLFTLIYGLMRGSAAEDSRYVFIAVTISLVIVLYLGYHRFVEPQEKVTKKKGKSK